MPSLKPVWLRPVAAVTIFYMVCFAFGGIAERIDGDQGLFDIPQYGFEFYIRGLDLFSFGAFQHFFPETYSSTVVYTASGSNTVILFNAVMGLLVFGLVLKLAFGFIPSLVGKRTETE
ncbi:MAG: hypothetical protein RIB03_03615 [Henriciella sp.]|uniref:hypothetical protein n=1 Tax=Henriciella sp. TaxID=1968823 RepID=UPI0032EAB1E2